MGLQLSDKELDAMDGLPHFHRCIYIFGIRRYMDFTTGITGIEREISYKSLAEEVYVKPHKGVAGSGENSRHQVQRALILLEKKGLISRHSFVSKDEKRLIIKCLLANRDQSVQNKGAPYPLYSPFDKGALKAALDENKENPIKIDTSCNKKEESRPETPWSGLEVENGKGAPHPLSVDLIRSDLRGQVLNLLEERQFSIAYLIHNKTVAMLKVLEENKFTFEEIEEAIKHADAQLGTRPKVPWYYLDPILQRRAELTYAQEKAARSSKEINNNATKAKPQSNNKFRSISDRTHDVLAAVPDEWPDEKK